ncbi:substrate-binding protein [Sneathiella chinensis]|uniref:ABC transporter substrate-binding protein n=1 Tax=Sneathiella chinensis TaxID=349750 RepID=A0ABQ5U839_9PROT|nr:substrate-binding protein [Sneathiella chinensis]GLQ06641.1 ABC transporter substrate-binding protein [Sneathiella chinensis]
MNITRRNFMASVGAVTAASTFPMPSLASGTTIKVGAVQPFSGGLELFGKQAKMGLDLAMAEINAAGGIMGHPVEVLYEDNKTDPKTSVERARKVIQRDGAMAVSGPITSAAKDAMAGTMRRLKTPLFYATNYEGGICDRYLFSFNTVPNQDTAPLIPYLKEIGAGSRYYMFGADYVWPRNMFKAANSMIDTIGGETIAEEYTPFGVKDFSSVIRKIADSGAEILLFALPGADGITFIKQAEEFGLMQKVTVAFLGFAETYLGAFGPGKGEGMYAGLPLIASSEEPGVQEFVSKIRKQEGDDAVVSFYVMTHYNSLMAMKAGMEKAGKVDREALIDGMAGLTFDIPTGKARITEQDHHIAMNMYIGKTADGSLKVEKALGMIEPANQCG